MAQVQEVQDTFRKRRGGSSTGAKFGAWSFRVVRSVGSGGFCLRVYETAESTVDEQLVDLMLEEIRGSLAAKASGC